MLASGNGSLATVIILLKHGADVNIKTNGISLLENVKNRKYLIKCPEITTKLIKLLDEHV